MKEDFVKAINSTYKLLEFFPDNDPLKNKAKEKALMILGNLTLISDEDGWASLKKERAISELLDDIEILKNYLRLGKYQGWVGGINYLILLKEYEKIKNHLRPVKSTIGRVQKETEIGKRQDEIIEKLKEQKEPATLQTSPPKAFNKQGGKSSSRQEKIIEIIGNLGKAQVSDIIKEIPNITKRTIRRDLDELLKKAKIIRNGEWNKVFYQVA